MDQTKAISLLQNAIASTQPQRWADLGCGSGTFTLALNSILPAGSQVTAVDKHSQKLPGEFLKADFEKDDLPIPGLDGILMANSFHYVRDKPRLIKKLENYFGKDPCFLIVEYNSGRTNSWVPYPIDYQNLHELFMTLGYTNITKLSEAPSRFGGSIYSALIRL